MKKNHKTAAMNFLRGIEKTGDVALNGLRRWSIRKMNGLVCFFSYDMLIAAYDEANSSFVYATKYAIYQENKNQSLTTSAQFNALQYALKEAGKIVRFVESYAPESAVGKLFSQHRTR